MKRRRSGSGSGSGSGSPERKRPRVLWTESLRSAKASQRVFIRKGNGLVEKLKRRVFGVPYAIMREHEMLWWAAAEVGISVSSFSQPSIYKTKKAIRTKEVALWRKKTRPLADPRAPAPTPTPTPTCLGGGSSRRLAGGTRSTLAQGKLVDAEIAHLVNCCGVQSARVPFGSKFADATRMKAGRCGSCGLANVKGAYARKTPGWQRLTKAYLEDCDVVGLLLVASQVHVCDPATDTETFLDEVGVDVATGRCVVVERKCGHSYVTLEQGGESRVREVPLRDGARSDDTAPSVISLPVSRHCLNRIQAIIGAYLLTMDPGGGKDSGLAAMGMPATMVVYMRTRPRSAQKTTPATGTAGVWVSGHGWCESLPCVEAIYRLVAGSAPESGPVRRREDTV